MQIKNVLDLLGTYWQIPLLAGIFGLYEYERYDALHNHRKTTQHVRAQKPRVDKKYLKRDPQGIVCGKVGGKFYCLPEQKTESGYEMMHALVIGGSGTGKTSSVYAESILADWKNMKETPHLAYNFLAIDIKGELHERFCPPVGGPEEDNSYYLIDPVDKEHSYGFDPFGMMDELYVRDRDSVMQTASDIASAFITVTERDAYFSKNALSMLSGFIAYCMESCPRIEFVDMMQMLLQRDVKELLHTACDSMEEGSATRFYLGRFYSKSNENESLEDIISTMTTSLSAFGLDSVKYMLKDNGHKISADWIRKKPVILSVPDNMLDENTFAPIYRMIITLMQGYLISRVPCDEERPVVLFYDELFSMGGAEKGAGIPGLQKFMSIARQYGVACCAAVQSEKMLVKQYGREGAKILEDNMVKVILNISDSDTIKAAKEWTGKFDNRNVSTTNGRVTSSTISWSEQDIFSGADFTSLVSKKRVIVVPLIDSFAQVEKSQWFKEKKFLHMQESLLQKKTGYTEIARTFMSFANGLSESERNKILRVAAHGLNERNDNDEINQILSCMNSAPVLDNDIVVYRGGRCIMDERPIISVSLSKEVAIMYAGGNSRVTKIVIKRGAKFLPVMVFAGRENDPEQELIIDATRLKKRAAHYVYE